MSIGYQSMCTPHRVGTLVEPNHSHLVGLSSFFSPPLPLLCSYGLDAGIDKKDVKDDNVQSATTTAAYTRRSFGRDSSFSSF